MEDSCLSHSFNCVAQDESTTCADSSTSLASDYNTKNEKQNCSLPMILKMRFDKLQPIMTISDLMERHFAETSFSNTLLPTSHTLNPPDPTSTERYHIHFSFQQKEDMLMIMDTLESRGDGAKSSVFLDTFYDTPTLTLTTKNIVLRDRNGTLSLIIKSPHVHQIGNSDHTSFVHITDLREIAEIIRDITQTPNDMLVSLLKRNVALEKRLKRRLRQWIQTICSSVIASLPTLRYTYSLKNDIHIHIDTIVCPTHKMTIGIIDCSNSTKTLQVLKSLNLSRYRVWPTFSKFAISLSQSDDQQVRKVAQEIFPLFHIDHILADGKEHLEYPWSAFLDATTMATGAFMPLERAFYHVEALKDVE